MQKISVAEQYLIFCYFYDHYFWKVTVQPSSNASADVSLKVTPMNRSFGDSRQHSFDDLDIYISDDDASSVINDRIVTLPDFGLSDNAPLTNTGAGSDTKLEFVNYFRVPGQNKSVIGKADYPRLTQVTQQSIITPKSYRRITTNSNRAQKRHATIESPRIRKSLINKTDSHLRNTSIKADSGKRKNFPVKLLLIVHFSANCDFQYLITKKITKGAICRCSHAVKNLPLVGAKYARIRVFPDRHFPVYRQNLRFCPYTVKLVSEKTFIVE